MRPLTEPTDMAMMYMSGNHESGAKTMRVGVARIRNTLADALNRVAYSGERVILERRGKGVAALVSMDDLELLEAVEDRIDLEAARQARAEGGKPIPLEQLADWLGIKLPRNPSRRNKPAGKRGK